MVSTRYRVGDLIMVISRLQISPREEGDVEGNVVMVL